MLNKVLIVDFGSQVTQLIARSVRSRKVYCEVVPFNKISLNYIKIGIYRIGETGTTSFAYNNLLVKNK